MLHDSLSHITDDPEEQIVTKNVVRLGLSLPGVEDFMYRLHRLFHNNG